MVSAPINPGIIAVAESSQVHITWALSMIGGSIATVIGTSHLVPKNKICRSVYLLFIPGWMCLGISIWFGDLVSRGRIAAEFVKQDALRGLLKTMNSNYASQLYWMKWGLCVFLLWLILYLVWWIYFRKIGNDNERGKKWSHFDHG